MVERGGAGIRQSPGSELSSASINFDLGKKPPASRWFSSRLDILLVLAELQPGEDVLVLAAAAVWGLQRFKRYSLGQK